MKEMNKTQYIAELSRYLNNIQEDEFDDAIRYVEEYFDEAGEENVSKVIEELGPPNKLAATIRAESTIKNSSNKQTQQESTKSHYTPRSGRHDMKSIWVIILGIFALPIALPLAFALLMLVFAFFMVIGSLLIAAACCTFALLLVSIPALISSFVLLGTNFMDGLVALGISLTTLGAGLFFLSLTILAITAFIPWMKRCFTNIFQRFNNKRSYSV